MPPADFCNGVFPEHTCGLPKPRWRCCSGKPLRQRAAPALASRDQPRFLRPGVARACWPVQPPPRRPLALVDLPQPDRLGHLLSRIRAGFGLKAQPSPTTVRNRSLSNEPAGRASPKRNPPGRAVSCASSRKGPPSTAPEVPSTVELPRCRVMAAFSHRRIDEAWRSDAFVSPAAARLDEAGIASARPAGPGVRLDVPFPVDRSALDSFCAWNRS